MFTGIIECLGKLIGIQHDNGMLTLQIESAISHELKVDQSLSHNGICLTVIEVKGHTHKVQAVDETIRKTTIAAWALGHEINLERGMKLEARLDGHLVQGHIDGKATCVSRNDVDRNWVYTFQFDEQFAALVIEKGSITVNGTSLTCYEVTRNTFTVAIIPYTYHHTNIKQVHVGSEVNIEFDLIGKYINRKQELAHT